MNKVLLLPFFSTFCSYVLSLRSVLQRKSAAFMQLPVAKHRLSDICVPATGVRSTQPPTISPLHCNQQIFFETAYVSKEDAPKVP